VMKENLMRNLRASGLFSLFLVYSDSNNNGCDIPFHASTVNTLVWTVDDMGLINFLFYF
jgi:hypothetical protein